MSTRTPSVALALFLGSVFVTLAAESVQAQNRPGAIGDPENRLFDPALFSAMEFRLVGPYRVVRRERGGARLYSAATRIFARGRPFSSLTLKR